VSLIILQGVVAIEASDPRLPFDFTLILASRNSLDEWNQLSVCCKKVPSAG
jgi:hypothetical protein